MPLSSLTLTASRSIIVYYHITSVITVATERKTCVDSQVEHCRITITEWLHNEPTDCLTMHWCYLLLFLGLLIRKKASSDN